MALSAKLQVRQHQSLTMTPQLMQAIRLLQMSAGELERFVEEEMNNNPVLSRADEGETRNPADPVLDEASDLGEAAPAEADVSAIIDSERPSGNSDLDVSAVDTHPGSEPVGRDPLPRRTGAPGHGHDEFTPDLEATLSARPGLVGHLEDQINAIFDDPTDRAIALALLAHLDPAGYLTAPITDIAQALAAPPGTVEAVLRHCQTVEPTGAFSRSLGECLALQLAELDRLDPAMQAMLDNLELLMTGEEAALQRRCAVSAEDFREMLDEIRALDPKPGLAFGHEPTAVAVPDVLVRAAPDGGWTVELNEDVLPRILVDRSYYARIADCGSKTDRKFIVDCLQQASWLEKSLDQRARTILKVAAEIVTRQDAFLRHGVSRLRPLTLRAVADAVGVHESTVSRATANKYMATPRGLFELKFFFSNAISSNSGADDHSSEAVKHRIRQLVDAEPADAVLSDDAIVDLLHEEGIVIARRTVAKYRDILRIPSSVQRRRQKRRAAAG